MTAVVTVLIAQFEDNFDAALTGGSSRGGALAPGLGPASAWLALTSLESSAPAPLSLDPGAALDGFRRGPTVLSQE